MAYRAWEPNPAGEQTLGQEHLLSSSPSWREYDREFSKLIDDPSGASLGGSLAQRAAAGADHPGECLQPSGPVLDSCVNLRDRQRDPTT
jgi:hypothetical protein